jgi:Domain of unknown function (DUF4157)
MFARHIATRSPTTHMAADSAGAHRRLTPDKFSGVGNQARLRLAAAPGPGLQPKVDAGAVNDSLEREASQAAGAALALSNDAKPTQTSRSVVGHSPTPDLLGVPAFAEVALREPGLALDAATRAFFEPRFAPNLAAVRVHTTPAAARSAADAGASAFAFGNHMVFAAGAYAPGAEFGRTLLAHELAHTIQHQANPAGPQLHYAPENPQEAAKPLGPAALMRRLTSDPAYIDNDIRKVSFYGAELAVVTYGDGSVLELGLVPRWMQPPVVEVDYHTPKEDLAWSFTPTTIGYVRLKNVPPNTSFGEMQRNATEVAFYVGPVKKGARILPSRVNMLTAPTLCSVLKHSEDQFEENVKFVAEFGIEVSKVIGWMGAGKAPGEAPAAANVAGGVAARIAARAAARRVVSNLAGEMEELLVTGAAKNIAAEGVTFAGATVRAEGERLIVSRFKLVADVPGAGQGSIMREAFEEAAVDVARRKGLKTVTIDVGIVTNEGWRVVLEGVGYVRTQISTSGGGFATAWIKTIHL